MKLALMYKDRLPEAVRNELEQLVAAINRALPETTQTTVGSAGTASALPPNPTGYKVEVIDGTERVTPFYAKT